MKCPKCNYVSHDYLDACRKCGTDLVDFKKELHLQAIRPGDLDLSVVLSEHIEEIGATTEFGVDKDFFETQVLVEPGEGAADEEGFDISLDDEFLQAPAEAVASLEDRVELADDEAFTALDEDDEAEVDVRPSGSTVVEQPTHATPPVDMIDMSDLELDDVTLDLPEEAPDEVVEAFPAPEPVTEAISTPTLDVDRIASDAAPELADLGLALPETPTPEAPPARPPAAPLEDLPPLAADDLLEAELELEVETEPTAPTTSTPQPEVVLDLDLEELELEDDEKNA